MEKNHFDILILIGRPASGKREIINFLMCTSPQIRRQKFSTGDLDILDDFPMLWTWIEEDRILSERLRQPRLHTDEEGYFKHHYFWDLLIERLDLEYHKRLRDEPTYHDQTTTLVEFSRGSEHGGYTRAFPHLSADLLERAAILYVQVPFEESLRKNRRRFNPERPDSILEHALPDEKLARLYRDDDWEELATGGSGFIHIGSKRVPYAVFNNEDDLTTSQPDRLGERLKTVTGRLWALYQKRA